MGNVPPMNDKECSTSSLYYQDKAGSLFTLSSATTKNNKVSVRPATKVREGDERLKHSTYVCMFCHGQWRQFEDAINHNGVTTK